MLWKRYIQLTEAEWAFRITKDELEDPADVALPTRTKDGHYSGTVRLRCVTEPDEAQKVLLHRLANPVDAAASQNR